MSIIIINRVVSLDRLLLIINTTPNVLLERFKYKYDMLKNRVSITIESMCYIVKTNTKYSIEHLEYVVSKEIIKMIQHNNNIYRDYQSLVELVSEIMLRIGFNISDNDIKDKLILYTDSINDVGIDYNIVASIDLLNKNGYTTFFSCSGHSVTEYKHNSMYITFKHTKKVISIIHDIINTFDNKTEMAIIHTRLSYHFITGEPLISIYVKVKDKIVSTEAYLKLNNILYNTISEFIKKDD